VLVIFWEVMGKRNEVGKKYPFVREIHIHSADELYLPAQAHRRQYQRFYPQTYLLVLCGGRGPWLFGAYNQATKVMVTYTFGQARPVPTCSATSNSLLDSHTIAVACFFIQIDCSAVGSRE